MSQEQRSCIILGSTGATGKCLVSSLIKSDRYSSIILLNRRFVDTFQDSKVEQRLVDFERMNDEHFKGASVAFCCIGTTLSKVSRSEFEYIERDLIVKLCQKLHQNGVLEFHLVSGFASDSKSCFFIPKIKGQCEEAVGKIGFQKLVIYRPGLLRCIRNERRPLETLARYISNILDSKYNVWSISTTDLATVMVLTSLIPSSSSALTILEHGHIVKCIPAAASTVSF